MIKIYLRIYYYELEDNKFTACHDQKDCKGCGSLEPTPF